MNKLIIKFLLVLSPFCFTNCIDPVEPEFEFKEGLVYIEGFASTTEGTSYVIVNKSVNEFGISKTVFVSGAKVDLINSDTGGIITLLEDEGAYVSPTGFKVNSRERWELYVILEDGTEYRSQPEIVTTPVQIDNFKTDYNPELQFNEGSDSFEPGHAVSVSFSDPIDIENFYYWSFRSYENLSICVTCYNGIYRDGSCQSTTVSSSDYFTYSCESDCWKIRFPERISIFSDQFSNGKTTTNLNVANIPLYTKENIVIELQQYSLTSEAYDYYKVLKDIVDNNSGFNAPPPAALIGNLYNPKNSEDFVFGRFTVAATTTMSLFIDRGGIRESALEERINPNFEPSPMSPYPPPATISAPCEEGRFRTAIEPNSWMR